jgi:hypothetical protein
MRYYFHLHNDVQSRDEEGRDLPSLEAARLVAVDEARVMAAESVGEGHLDLGHHIKVEDESRTIQFEVTFGDAVTVTSSN